MKLRVIFVVFAGLLFFGSKVTAKTGAEMKTDHFDGRLFFNPSGKGVKSFGDLLKWWTESKEPWPDWIENDKLPPLPAVVPAGELHVTFINHSTFLLRTADWTLLTDPHFGERASPVGFAGPKRVRRPAYEIEDIPAINFVVVSHNHYDHMDLPSLRKLRDKSKPEIFVPLRNKEFLAAQKMTNVFDLDWWQTEVRGDVKITLTPAEHWSARGLWDRNKMLWGGFVIEWKGKRIFFAGDTGYGTHFKEVNTRMGTVDLALLPIGAYEPRWFMKDAHINPAEAVQAHLDLGAKRSLGMHYGTFRLTNEAYDHPEQDLAKALIERKLPFEVFHASKWGETVVLR